MSMGSVSAIKLMQVLKNVSNVIAIELLISAQALDNRDYPSSRALEAAKARLRQVVPPLQEDRIMYPDINASIALIENAEILKAVQDSGIEIH